MNETKAHFFDVWVTVLVMAMVIGFLFLDNSTHKTESFDLINVSSSFRPEPLSHLGWFVNSINKKLLANHFDKVQTQKLVVYFQNFSNRVILITNSTQQFWWIAKVIIAGSFAFMLKLLVFTRRNDTHFLIFRALLIVGFLGFFCHLAWAPVTNNFFVLSLCSVVYFVGSFTIIVSLINSKNPNASDKKRFVHYGPKFREPQVNGEKSINIAAYTRKVLPENSRWAAKNGNWPIDIPAKKLSSGITILGEKGSGKSRLMFGIHDEIRIQYPNVPILIHDPKGEWYRTYFDETTDIVFGPNIDGSSNWDIWSDLKKHPEMVHGIINTAVYAHPSNGDTFWLDNAVRLLENAFSAPTLEDARSYLIAKKESNIDDKMFLSIYGTAKLALHDIVKVALSKIGKESNNRRMNIDDYLGLKGRILLLNNPAFAAEQKGAFSLFLSAFLLRALSLPDIPAGELRLVAFIDEALTFTLPPEVEKLIYTQCRSKGIVIIAGAQRLPDKGLRETGEWATAENIFAMKVLNLDTQAQLSKRAGDISYEEKTKTKQRDETGHDKGGSEASHSRTHAAIPPETFGRLANRECILFHDQGIAPCRTNMMGREQRDIHVPQYLARPDVTEFMKILD
jgi:hypothetical protein